MELLHAVLRHVGKNLHCTGPSIAAFKFQAYERSVTCTSYFFILPPHRVARARSEPGTRTRMAGASLQGPLRPRFSGAAAAIRVSAKDTDRIGWECSLVSCYLFSNYAPGFSYLLLLHSLRDSDGDAEVHDFA